MSGVTEPWRWGACRQLNISVLGLSHNGTAIHHRRCCLRQPSYAGDMSRDLVPKNTTNVDASRLPVPKPGRVTVMVGGWAGELMVLAGTGGGV